AGIRRRSGALQERVGTPFRLPGSCPARQPIRRTRCRGYRDWRRHAACARLAVLARWQAMRGSILVSTPDLRPSLQSVLQGLAERNLIGRVATTVSVASALTCSIARLPWAGPRLAPFLKRREVPAFLDGLVDNIWAGEVLRNL